MQLTLSSESVRNTTFTNETGQVIYKTSHPFSFKGTTTIHKVVPNDDPMDMRDQFEVMGEIEWHWVSATLRMNGQVLQSSEFMPKHGLGGRCVTHLLAIMLSFYGCAFRSKRPFTGPDGRKYRWDMLRKVVVVSAYSKNKRSPIRCSMFISVVVP